METIHNNNSIHCNSSSARRDTNNAALASLIMSSTSGCLDSSNHSWATPTTTEPQQTPSVTPVSPNAVEQFPTTTTGETSSLDAAAKPTSMPPKKSTLSCLDAAALPTIPATTEAPNNTKTNNSSILGTPPVLQCSCNDDSTVSLSSLSSSSSNSSTTVSNNSVRFNPLVRVKDILSRHDMSLKERYDYWIQDHEFLMIKRRNQMTILAILQAQEAETRIQTDAAGNATNPQQQHQQQQQQQQSCTNTDDATVMAVMEDNNCCLRGLESGLPNENLRKRSYRFAALEEVFLEQEDQYYAGIYDDEAIAQVYLEVTVECRFRAEFRAIQDRKEIEDYLQKDAQQWFAPVVASTTTTNVAPSNESDEDEFAIE